VAVRDVDGVTQLAPGGVIDDLAASTGLGEQGWVVILSLVMAVVAVDEAVRRIRRINFYDVIWLLLEYDDGARQGSTIDVIVRVLSRLRKGK